MSRIDDHPENLVSRAATPSAPNLTAAPRKNIVVVACMDARLEPISVLGLEEGDAHVVRNAGGVVTDDVIRSLVISQRLLGTREIVLIHHTDCGMLRFSDDEMKDAIEQETGSRPHFSMEPFTDLDANVRQSVARIEASPFVPHKDRIRGFVYEVETGILRELT
jgi:carbonic anhydrase